MSDDDTTFDNTEDFNVKLYLQSNRMVNLHFNKIHRHEIITKQIPNAHETYLPLHLQCWPLGDYVNVNDFFTTDFTPEFGNFDESTGIHKPKAFTVFGSRGSGKTALLHYLKYQWTMDDANDVTTIKDFDTAILINSNQISNYPSLPAMCREICFTYAPTTVTTGYLFSKLTGLKVLWLIDNFHEADESSRQVIKEVFINFPHSQVVVTCRWSQNEHLLAMLNDLEMKNVMIRLRPLTDDQWRLMVPKMVRAKTSDEHRINDVTNSFIADIEGLAGTVQLILPYDLGMSLNVWIEELYPIVRGGATRTRMLARFKRMIGIPDGGDGEGVGNEN